MKVWPAETNVELIKLGVEVVFENGPLLVGDAGKPDDAPVPLAPGQFVQADQ